MKTRLDKQDKKLSLALPLLAKDILRMHGSKWTPMGQQLTNCPSEAEALTPRILEQDITVSCRCTTYHAETETPLLKWSGNDLQACLSILSEAVFLPQACKASPLSGQCPTAGGNYQADSGAVHPGPLWVLRENGDPNKGEGERGSRGDTHDINVSWIERKTFIKIYLSRRSTFIFRYLCIRF